jgi:hypothetical protein
MISTQVAVLFILFIPLFIVTGYVYATKRAYERSRLKKKAHYRLRRKK